MIKIAASCRGLTFGLKYRYTPVSNYEVQHKVNPIIAVTIGSDHAELFDLHFRVHHLQLSFLKTLSRRLLRTSSDCCWVVPVTRDAPFR